MEVRCSMFLQAPPFPEIVALLRMEVRRSMFLQTPEPSLASVPVPFPVRGLLSEAIRGIYFPESER